MLSRFAVRTILSQKQFFGLPCVRPASTAAVPSEEVPEKKFIETSYVDFDETKPVALLDNDKVPLPSPFTGPERDLVNFPKPVRLEYNHPSRHLIFPEEWFRFMYPKLGVSGPYTLGLGIAAFLVSKELYLIDDHEFKHTAAFFTWVYIFCKTPLGKVFTKIEQDGLEEETTYFREARKRNEQDRIDAIEHEKKEQWRQEGKKILFQAKRDAIGLQLEAAYRQNIINLYNQVKRRLDYQVEIGKIDARIKQQFMIQWVVDKVQEAIAAQPEKETLKKCIADLNLLAAKA